MVRGCGCVDARCDLKLKSGTPSGVRPYYGLIPVVALADSLNHRLPSKVPSGDGEGLWVHSDFVPLLADFLGEGGEDAFVFDEDGADYGGIVGVAPFRNGIGN